VAIMNNGPNRGGAPAAFSAVRATPGIDLWQLHTSRAGGDANASDEFIANVDDGTQTAFALKLIASEDGSFRVSNPRTNFTKTYAVR